MSIVGVFFGSDTGNTAAVAEMIESRFGAHRVEVRDISKCSRSDLDRFELLLLGIPTWYYGEAQGDWDDFFPALATIDLSTKKVAIFGCGDQVDYSEYFCDAMGALRDILLSHGATLVGRWPTAGYAFGASKALVDDEHFVGLCIDQDRQPEMTGERVSRWVRQICTEMQIGELAG
jgi:flavodoxin I